MARETLAVRGYNRDRFPAQTQVAAMSISSEAKQAAVWAGWPNGSDGHRPFCEGYDTATAKLREELEEANKSADKWFEKWSALNLLAHQQPSAITDDGQGR